MTTSTQISFFLPLALLLWVCCWKDAQTPEFCSSVDQIPMDVAMSTLLMRIFKSTTGVQSGLILERAFGLQLLQWAHREGVCQQLFWTTSCKWSHLFYVYLSCQSLFYQYNLKCTCIDLSVVFEKCSNIKLSMQICSGRFWWPGVFENCRNIRAACKCLDAGEMVCSFETLYIHIHRLQSMQWNTASWLTHLS